MTFSIKTFTTILLAFFISLAFISCDNDDITPVDGGTEEPPKTTPDPEEILDDLKITVFSAEASSFQDGEGIELSYDGDPTTMWHSAWNNAAEDYFPITVVYNFEDVPAMDYIIYTPRQSGNNGLFKEFDLYVATTENPTLTLYGSYDFKGSSSASRLDFDETLVNPTAIQFVIKSGAGDNQGFATCAEMEFFQKNNENFDYLTIFTDETCTALKPEVNQETIDKINNRFFRELATQILAGTYDIEFRVQDYDSWQHPDIMAAINKTSTYGLRDNPTGVYAQTDEDIIVFVGETHGQNLAIIVQESGKKIDASSYPLAKGMNKFKAKNPGLMYIMYYTETGEEAPVKINIASGTVNGYFDKSRHKEEDWTRLLDAATYADFDVKGQYAILTFRTDAFRQYTSNGMDLINWYDRLVYDQQEFMGLVKYKKMFKNKAHFLVVDEGFMYAGGYHTGYNANTQSEILNPDVFSTSAIWGPAHELGHTHQTRPGLRWAGMAEVTNNIHSAYIQTLWGNRCRLIDEDMGGGFSRYDNGFNSTLVAGVALNDEPDVFVRLIPFWQLKLYLMDVLKKEDFYKDIYEFVRVTPDVSLSSSDQGLSQLQFVKAACDIAQLDLTEFFVMWGFLKPIDKSFDDYGMYQFSITQAEIDEVKAYIASKGYAKPTQKLQYITDDNVNLYTSNAAVTAGTGLIEGNTVTMSGWGNVVVFEAYKNGNLAYVTTKNTVSLPDNPADYEIYAVGVGLNDRVKVVAAEGDKIGIASAHASSSQPGEGIERSYDGNMGTLYHSAYDNSGDDYFPVILTYNFSNVSQMSRLTYHPRTEGRNGMFKEVDILVATEANPTLTLYKSFDFGGTLDPYTVTFDTPLVKPTSIQFVVKSGAGDGQGFATCAEMEFFRY